MAFRASKPMHSCPRSVTRAAAHDEKYNWRAISELGSRKSIVVEYLNKPQLVHFFRNRNKQEGSILQRFIPPRSTNNEMIRATWTPNVCLVDRRTNVYSLSDWRVDVYKRYVYGFCLAHDYILITFFCNRFTFRNQTRNL